MIDVSNDDDSTDEDGPEFELDDKEDNEPQYKMIDVNDKVEEPKESMMFDSLEEVEDYYRKYGRQVGFGVVKRTGKKGKDGSPKYITLTCIRQGKPKKGKGDCTKPVPKIIRTQCKARICATLCADGKSFLSYVVVEHNHCLSPEKSRFFRCYKNIDAEVKRRYELNDRAGIRLNKNFNSLVVEKGGYEQLTFGEEDCRNYIEKA
ncbi:protein FAR1-RELATED SEQUENCE 4-like [Alnus glutinosa]|uniref:protein FAR1-RELATED SEQUENCE 4-like n=1 Tax=Alnus glutinosa TaxID=3517 RepID=UPI002D7A0744|nr:protein FAR1-RELATED SEQUENCE 4-like [Alnus glutinosa]